ncbi:dienelactone hydrolase family protein [Mycobacterium kansasii]|uniref:Dienelactone hydrolase family protein n=1 Tax=Mycobacterium kansasii TaxID=1768 RepID=A0A1V3WC80_MYCKA|nr:dienelactone hydrolase family protein [Mycobacterium kansasii]
MTTIDIDTPAGTIDALLSVPTGEGPWPGVVVVHDAVGYAPTTRRFPSASPKRVIWR